MFITFNKKYVVVCTAYRSLQIGVKSESCSVMKTLHPENMKEIPIKKYVIYLFGIAISVFIINKLYFRSWVLKNDLPEFIRIATYSIPNLIEALILTLVLTGILLQIRLNFKKKFGSIKILSIYLLASGIAAVYVISQELKFHNIGGNNVSDTYDLVASVIGLIGTFVILQVFGFIEEGKIDIDKG